MATFQFSNETGFVISDNSRQSQSVQVYGLAGPVTSTAIFLKGLYHTFAADLDMLLVGPGSGHNLEFWSDASGQDNLAGNYQCLDNGAFQLTNGSSGNTPQEGAYRPVEYGEIETNGNFGSTAGAINHASPNGGASFASVFNGIDGNGAWTYYLADDSSGDTGTLGSWGLSITTASQVAQVDGTTGNDTISATSSGVNSGSYSLNSLGEVFFFDVVTLVLDGKGGDDTIVGSSAVDNIYGGAGRDAIYAGGGADLITVVSGDDTAGEVYDGGFGADTLIVSATLVPQNFTIDLRDDTLGSLEALRFSSGGNNTAGAVLMNASQFGSGLSLTASVSVVEAVNFAATLSITMGSVTSLDLSRLGFSAAFGADDKVVVTGDSDAETITGTSLADFLYGNAGGDTLRGGVGNDNLFGGAGGDALDGGAGLDYARYDDAAYGDIRVSLASVGVGTGVAAGDTFVGVEGLIMGGGNDHAYGDNGNNYIYGNQGNDNLFGSNGADYLNGGSGFDYVRFDDAAYAGLVASLANQAVNTGAAQGDSYVDVEGLILSGNADTGIGNAADNYLYGLGGSDTLYGREGHDNLFGGSDAGIADTFVFDVAATFANSDTIGDFQHNVDRIALASAIYGNNPASVYFDAGSHNLFWAGNNLASPSDDVLIATLTGVTTFTTADYYFY